MRFLDANIFVYAFYSAHRELTPRETEMKEHSKRILRGISDGDEMALTTVVHLSEVANILKRGMSSQRLSEFLLGLFMLETVMIEGVSADHYFSAVELGGELEVDPNDALAVEVMKKHGVDEIYSFDSDFDRIHGVTRVPS